MRKITFYCPKEETRSRERTQRAQKPSYKIEDEDENPPALGSYGAAGEDDNKTRRRRGRDRGRGRVKIDPH